MSVHGVLYEVKRGERRKKKKKEKRKRRKRNKEKIKRKKTDCVETTSVRPSDCDRLFATKLFVGFS
jgi:hypothetical protein